MVELSTLSFVLFSTCVFDNFVNILAMVVTLYYICIFWPFEMNIETSTNSSKTFLMVN
jgi:hypothetical protein